MHGIISLQNDPKDKIYERLSSDLPINSVVVPAVVDDPYDVGKLKVLRSVRDDPLAGMLARDQINKSQFDAGRLWQMYHEHSEIGGIRAIDPRKEAVDGGKFQDMFSEKQIIAFRELKRADNVLGLDGSALVRDILGRRRSITQAAAERGITAQLEIKYVGRRFRECLERLAVLWGFVTNG